MQFIIPKTVLPTVSVDVIFHYNSVIYVANLAILSLP